MLEKLLMQYKKYKIDYIKNVKKEKTIKGKFKKILPNILTSSRLVAPLIIIPVAISSMPLALIVATLFALTDAFDGYFARKFDAYSDYGRILDPVCDKVFAIGLSLPILIINPTLIISTIILELAIATINLNSSIKENEPKSTYLGKFKTALLSVNIILNYINIISIPFTIFTNLIQLTAAVDYYSIDKKKDLKKKFIKPEKTISCIKPCIENIEKNDFLRQKNELLELRKSLIEEKNEKDNQLIKKM